MRIDSAEGARVELLGHGGKVSHRVSDRKRLVIDVPNPKDGQRPCEHAFAFKLTGFQVGLSADVPRQSRAAAP